MISLRFTVLICIEFYDKYIFGSFWKHQFLRKDFLFLKMCKCLDSNELLRILFKTTFLTYGISRLTCLEKRKIIANSFSLRIRYLLLWVPVIAHPNEDYNKPRQLIVFRVSGSLSIAQLRVCNQSSCADNRRGEGVGYLIVKWYCTCSSNGWVFTWNAVHMGPYETSWNSCQRVVKGWRCCVAVL